MKEIKKITLQRNDKLSDRKATIVRTLKEFTDYSLVACKEVIDCVYLGLEAEIHFEPVTLNETDIRICQFRSRMNALGIDVIIEFQQNKEDMEEKKLNLKPFDLQKAKEGKPVCTRDGRKARIICFNLQSIENTPIVAAVQVTDKQEVIANYYENGRQFVDGISELDLMMLSEKKERWVNVYKTSSYKTEDEAKKHIAPSLNYIRTVKVEWEE